MGNDKFRKITRVEDFQDILKLLVEFDEKTGRHKRYEDNENHWIRKTIATCDPNKLLVMISHKENYVYVVNVTLINNTSKVNSEWMHEDGIMRERVELKDNLSHPVHSIICMADLYESGIDSKN